MTISFDLGKNSQNDYINAFHSRLQVSQLVSISFDPDENSQNDYINAFINEDVFDVVSLMCSLSKVHAPLFISL